MRHASGIADRLKGIKIKNGRLGKIRFARTTAFVFAQVCGDNMAGTFEEKRVPSNLFPVTQRAAMPLSPIKANVL